MTSPSPTFVLSPSAAILPRHFQPKSIVAKENPRVQPPWAHTPFLPEFNDVAEGCNHEKRKPVDTGDADALYQAECVRASEAVFTSQSRQDLRQPLAKNDAFHHYYKKHMTMLGLAKCLDGSSDSDSETSENFQTKLFVRRPHFPVTKKRLAASRLAVDGSGGDAEMAKQKNKSSSWSFRCPSVVDIGVVSDDPHHAGRLAALAKQRSEKGKKVFPHGFEADNRYPEPHPVRLRGRERYQAEMELSRDTPTSLPNSWDRRTEEEAAARALRKRRGPTAEERSRSVMLSPVEQTKIRIAEEVAAEKAARSRRHHRTSVVGSREGRSSTGGDGASREGPRRSSSSLSAATQLTIERRVKELAASERESLARHKQIMALVHRLPIEDPLPPTVDS